MHERFLVATLTVGLACVSLGACSRDTPDTRPPTSDPATAEAPADEPPAAASASASGGAVAASCLPWGPWPRSAETYSVAGRGDFFRRFRYDFKSGVLSVHDSDPFANGDEAKQPRVIEKQVTLDAAQKKRVEATITAVCPTTGDMTAACAPGGCAYLLVKDDDSEMRVEHAPTAAAVAKHFKPFFPELR